MEDKTDTQDKTSGNPSARTMRWLLLAIGGGMLAYWAAGEWRYYQAFRSWDVAEGQVSLKHKEPGNRHGPSFWLAYTYEIGGLSHATGLLNVSRHYYEKIEPGQRLRIRVNPNDPSDSLWLLSVQMSRFGNVLQLFLLGVLIPAGILASWLWRWDEEGGVFRSRILPPAGTLTVYAVRALVFVLLVTGLVAGIMTWSKTALPVYSGPFPQSDGTELY